jgi:hypothetical protein
MIVHLVRMTGITVLIVFCVFYPFLQGEYDGLATALSAAAQVFVLVGVLLVPIGILWVLYELRKQARRKRTLTPKARGYYFALISLIAGSFVALAACLGGFVTNIGFAFGIGMLALWAYIISRVIPRLKLLKNAEPEAFNPVPLYLIFIPPVALLFQVTLAAPATEFSRNKAIANSAELINDIETYHAAHGQYPLSLSGLWPDYKPSVIGIEQFHYASNGGAYNLFFEQPTFLLTAFGTREIVMYNKLDEHIMLSHASWNLTRPPEGLAASQGWYRVQDASSPHWKYFWFD